MDNEQLRGYAERARSLAATADPFTQKRLLDLAARYEEQTREGKPRARTSLLPRPSMDRLA